MPFIPESDRTDLDPGLRSVIAALVRRDPNQLDAGFAYVLYRLTVELYDVRFASLSRAIGVLATTIHCIYRYLLGPREDEIKEKDMVEKWCTNDPNSVLLGE